MELSEIIMQRTYLLESIASNPGLLLTLGIVIMIVTGIALYKAARLSEKGWFWSILILNTLGILPAVYLYLRRKKSA